MMGRALRKVKTPNSSWQFLLLPILLLILVEQHLGLLTELQLLRATATHRDTHRAAIKQDGKGECRNY